MVPYILLVNDQHWKQHVKEVSYTRSSQGFMEEKEKRKEKTEEEADTKRHTHDIDKQVQTQRHTWDSRMERNGME